MFNVDELTYINKVLIESCSHDETAQMLIEKITICLKNASETNECLWKFFWDCGRQGEVEGVFKATKEDLENAIGKEIYFGEILGKHSDVYGPLEECDYELISDEAIYVMNAIESGYNPLDYIRDEEG